MKSTKAASRYAKALLELAIEQNSLEQVSTDMRYLLEVNTETKDFQMLLSSPIVKSDKKLQIFGELFDQFEKLTTLFIHQVTKNGREYMLPEIAQSYERQLKAYKGIVPVTLITATALDNTTRSNIIAKIQNAVKGQLEIHEQIDESLIGGFIVRMDDKQVDASVINQFNNLKQRLTN
jgi:F-type H+-transporting ATPase subunit delta